MRSQCIVELVGALALTVLIAGLLPRGPEDGNVVAAAVRAWRAHSASSPTFDEVLGRQAKLDAGHVDLISTESNTLLIEGWAAEIASKKPARSVQAFVNGRNVGIFSQRYGRPDVSDALGIPRSEQLGFRLHVTAKPTDSVRVFAELSDGSFAELRYPPVVPPMTSDGR